jgi:hypothetical protein
MLTVWKGAAPLFAALLLMCSTPPGAKQDNMNGLLELSTDFKLQENSLILDYKVSNHASRDVYLLNRLYRSIPEWDMSPNLVYIHLDPATKTVWLNKKIADLPSDFLVNVPVSPFVTTVRAGKVFREEVQVALPVREYRQYNPGARHVAPRPAATFKQVYFTLGFYWRPEGTLEETREIHGTRVIFPHTPPGKPLEFGELHTDMVRLDIPALLE